MKFALIILLLLAFSLVSELRAENSPQQIADQELPSLLAIYKDVHTHPELSTQEKRTSELVAKELKAAGCEVTDHIGLVLFTLRFLAVMSTAAAPARPSAPVWLSSSP